MFHKILRICILVMSATLVGCMMGGSVSSVKPIPSVADSTPTSTSAKPGFQVFTLSTPQLGDLKAHVGPKTTKKVKYDIYKGPNTTDYVLLTYDDCPASAKAFKSVIDYVSGRGFTLIVFPTGVCVKSHLKRGFDLVQYARNRGIWVGNHSYDHPQLTRLSADKIKAQITNIKAGVGRPPYGAINDKVRKAYAKAGMRPVLWDVDTNDWRGKSRSQVVNHVGKYARKGSNVLMHLQHKGFSVEAIKAIESKLAKRGLELCPVWRGEDRSGSIEPTTVSFPDNIC